MYSNHTHTHTHTHTHMRTWAGVYVLNPKSHKATKYALAYDSLVGLELAPYRDNWVTLHVPEEGRLFKVCAHLCIFTCIYIYKCV